MPQHVVTFTKDIIKKMEIYYEAFISTPNPPGAVFRAKTTNCVITAYNSGKVLFQGATPEIEFLKWNKNDKTALENSNNIKQTPRILELPNDFLLGNHSGSDEAGTGDYFGPITVAAAFVQGDQIELLKELGIQDSKNLTDNKIRKLSESIIQLEIPYSLLIMNNEKYNKLQASGWTQGKMKTMLHHHAYLKLYKKTKDIDSKGSLIDQFCIPSVYKKHLASEGETIPENTYFKTKAESHSISVATASIIARTSFLKEMDKLSELTGFTLPKGAAKKVDLTIASVIKKHGSPFLNEIAKVHFVNTKKANTYL